MSRSVVGVLEVKHRVQAAGKRIEGARDPLTTQPVVLDKPQDRGLVGDRVIDVVLLGVGRNHQQRKTGTISATSLGMVDGDTGKSASLPFRIGRGR